MLDITTAREQLHNTNVLDLGLVRSVDNLVKELPR